MAERLREERHLYDTPGGRFMSNRPGEVRVRRNNPVVSAVIFDMDGLLADTEWPDYETWRELFREHGGDLTLSEWIGEVGVWGAATIKARFAALLGSGEGLEEALARRRARFRARVAGLRPLPGVEPLLETLAARGIPFAVASSSDREWVAYVLGVLNLRERLTVVVTGDDVAVRKPAPDVYLAAAGRLGVLPARCIAFEDSAVGVAAAVSAGMRCVAVPNRLTVHHDLSRAHSRVRTLEEVDLDRLATLLEP